MTRLPKVNDAALAVVARASDAIVVATRRAFMLTPNKKCEKNFSSFVPRGCSEVGPPFARRTDQAISSSLRLRPDAVGPTDAMSPAAATERDFPRAADYDSERGWRPGTALICSAHFRQAVELRCV